MMMENNLEKKPRVLAVMSMPRLAFTDNMRCVSMLAEMGIPCIYSTGAYWAKGVNNCFQVAINNGYDYVLSIDYDAIFTKDDIFYLLSAAKQLKMPALAGNMWGREDIGPLYTVNPDFKGDTNEIIPVETAHFGLTVLDVTMLSDLGSEWVSGWNDEVDPDIQFWYDVKSWGYQAYVHKGVNVGHLELRIKWAGDDNYQGLDSYYANGKP